RVIVILLSSGASVSRSFYALSLHDALPILLVCTRRALQLHLRGGDRLPGLFTLPDQDLELGLQLAPPGDRRVGGDQHVPGFNERSEEHTSELQSRENIVCRLLLEKKKKIVF